MNTNLFQRLYAASPYALSQAEKKETLNNVIMDLTRYHFANCEAYRKILKSTSFSVDDDHALEDIPFLPAGLFKHLKLASIKDSLIYRTLTSSGTTGHNISKIYLDKETSMLQMRTLSHIISDFIGRDRLPLLIIDSSAVVNNSSYFSARTAGIMGFSIYGKDITYALDSQMRINLSAIEQFIERHQAKPYLIFGYTYIIWQHFLRVLINEGSVISLAQGIMIHGGGWKNMIKQKITDDVFRAKLNKHCQIKRVYDYYGMVEQTGSIYVQCEKGYFHCSNYSDIFIRRSGNFSVCEIGEKGIIQTISAIPRSYPGHNLLTEDEGVLYGEDDCQCKRKGRYFKVLGRVKNSETRGCGDTYGDKHA